jgi:hypothetical protein
VIQLTAIVSGQPVPMLTGNPLAEAAKSCKDRFGARFEGFDMPDWQRAAHEKWAAFMAKEIDRGELNDWLSGQGEEVAIRGIFNRLRG